MIKNFKKKIILYIMIVIGGFSIIFSCGFSIYSINKFRRELYVSMENQLKNEHNPQEIGRKDEQSPTLNTDTCIVSMNESTKEITVISNKLNLEEDSISDFVNIALESKQREGKINKNNLLFVVEHSQDGLRIAFTSKEYLTNRILTICLTSLSVTLIFLVIVFFISLMVANFAVKPVQKSIEQQKRFIADASHELKTPLAVISANNKIIEKSATKKQKEWIESNNEEIKAMSDIISEMLTLAQTEAMSNVSKTDVNISKLATACCLQFEPVAYEKNIELKQEIEKDINVLFDEKMLKKLIVILIDNAIKYESEKGEVIISVKKNGSNTVLKVKNQNSFIPKEKLTHIFERFYKVDETHSSEGFGLGLSIAKNIVDLNGCDISVASDKENGTYFEVKI